MYARALISAQSWLCRAWWRALWQKRTWRTPLRPTTWQAAWALLCAMPPSPAVEALNHAGPPASIPAMPQVVNASQCRLLNSQVALYGIWKEWHTSIGAGRPLSVAKAL